MEQNEMMVGDLIWIGNDTNRPTVPMKIKSIVASNSIGEKCIWVDAYDSEKYPYYGYGCVYETWYPIPLTDEMLELNGISEYVKSSDGDHEIYGVKIEEEGCSIFKFFAFVHELQHAYRLANMKNKADSFKLY